MKILLASDHAGYKLKKIIETHLQNKKYETKDLGCNSKEKSNYAYYGLNMGKSISQKEADFGILICGTGIGISIAANRFKGVRAARILNLDDAKIARMHNDANIACLGSRCVSEEINIKIIDEFLQQKFDGGRHIERVKTLDKICEY